MWLEWVEQFAIWFLQFPLVTSSTTHYSLSVGGLQQWRPRQLCTTSEEFPLTEFLHLLGATNGSKFRSSISLKINCYYRFSSELEQKQPSCVCSRIEIERLNAGVFTFTTLMYWFFLMPRYGFRVLVMGWGRSRDRYIKGHWTWEICLRHHESILSRSRTGNGRCEDGWEEGIHDGNPRCYLCHI